MALPLTPGQLIAYNNVATTPPDNPLGDILNDLTQSAGAQVLVYDPAATSSSPANVYATFPEALAAAQTLVGLVTVELAPDPASEIPAGIYDFQNRIAISGRLNLTGPSPTIVRDGATFINLFSFDLQTFLQTESLSPVVEVAAGSTVGFILQEGSEITTLPGAAPFFSVADTGVLFLIGRFGGRISTGPVPVVDLVSPGSVLSAQLYDDASIEDDILSGVGTAFFESRSPASRFSSTQTAFTGFLSIGFSSLSSNVAYSAVVPADWSGSPPATVQEALDRLASFLGPIP